MDRHFFICFWTIFNLNWQFFDNMYSNIMNWILINYIFDLSYIRIDSPNFLKTHVTINIMNRLFSSVFELFSIRIDTILIFLETIND